MKRVVTIQDVSCIGKCSATVALPIISVMGSECAVVPTAVLSTHTMFQGFTFRDLTSDISAIVDHWKKENFKFDAIYTGYLGSFEQLQLVSDFIDTFKTDSTAVIIDPVMADNGKLYPGFTPEFAVAMGKLCGKADVIVPNLTEAAYMLEEPYCGSGYDEAWVKGLLKRLAGLGAKNVVLTGISFEPGQLGIYGYNAVKDEYFSYFHKRLDASFHGTGDVFASTMTGAYVQGKSLLDSLKIAADYTVKCIINTQGDADHWYGAKFETALRDLIDMLA